MNQLQFDIHKSFFLHIDGWGQAQLQDITKLLDNVIITFYSKSLVDYVEDIIEKPENKISKPFKNWLTENLGELYKNRYKRTENRIAALQLFQLFKYRPELWTTIQYLKFIKVTNEMTFDNFIDVWTESAPDKLKPLISEIRTTLNDEKAFT